MSRGLRRSLGVALALAVLGFLGYTIARNWGEVRAHDWDVDGLELAASVVALVLVLAWGVFVWGRVLARLWPERVPFLRLLHVWFLSSLARYVPGKIWQFVGAAQLAPTVGAPAAVLLTSLVMHMGFTLLGAAVVSLLLLLPAGPGIEIGSTAGVAAVAAASLLLVHPRVLNAGLRLVPRAVHSEVVKWRGRWSDGLVLLALSVVSWLAYGAVFTLFVDSLIDVPAATLVPLTGANAFAFLVGYLFFLAPAGLGAREAILTVLLTPFAPTGVAAAVAVATRLWSIVAEVAGAVLLLPVGRRPR